MDHMIVVPSPRVLVHQKSDMISSQLLHVEAPLGNSDVETLRKVQESIFMDLRVLANHSRSSKLTIQNSTISTFFANGEKTCSYLINGLLAKKNHDPISAINLLYEVAKTGNTRAMLEIGNMLKKMCSFQKAILWFTRAARMGSIDAIYSLANVYFDIEDFKSALFFYATHFRFTKSLHTGFKIAKAFLNLGKKKTSMKWLRYCAANGLHSAVQEIIAIIGNDTEMHSVIYQWLRVATRLKTVKQQPFYWSSVLSAIQVKDRTLPPLNSASWKLNDPYVGNSITPRYLPHEVHVVSHEPKLLPGLDCLGNELDQTIPYSAAKNPVSRLLMVLELASPDPAKRNLVLCESYLTAFRREDPVFPFDLSVWRSKCCSDDPAELVKCGFVACVLGDYKFGLSLFHKASATGDETAALMCGLILYYGLNGKKEPEKGVMCMSRCQMNPIALMHMWIACRDKNGWGRRAKSLLTGDLHCKTVCEMIGDWFNKGIAFPRNRKVALAWYYLQLEKSEKYGIDTDDLVEKISSLVYERMCEQ